MMTDETKPPSGHVPHACARGHLLAADHPQGTPCPWPECCEHEGSTLSSPGIAEFPIRRIVREGLEVGEVIGTFWREATQDGWRWKLLGSRERLHP